MAAMWHWIVEVLKKPEWVAAIALLTQAGILLLQAFILRKHSTAMEENVKIAKTQADTAQLVGKALENQGTILAEQTRIMNEQFLFSRRVTTQAERLNIYDSLLAVSIALDSLMRTIEAAPKPRTPDQNNLELQQSRKLTMAISPCQKALLTSLYLSKEEKKYFIGYINELIDVRPTTTNVIGDVAALKSFCCKYSDFIERVLKLGQSEI